MNKSFPAMLVLHKFLPINFSQAKQNLTKKSLPNETKAINQILTEWNYMQLIKYL